MLVEAHGTFATATCTACLRKYEGEDLRVSQNALLHKNDSEFYFLLVIFDKLDIWDVMNSATHTGDTFPLRAASGCKFHVAFIARLVVPTLKLVTDTRF